jgi:hypothetical protein
VQYALLIYGSFDRWEDLGEEERQQQMREYMELGERPETRGGADLGEVSTATTVRVQDGETVTTDGPFAETKEFLGGLYLVECENLDDAIEFASKIPAARTGGAIEVRPVVEH